MGVTGRVEISSLGGLMERVEAKRKRRDHIFHVHELLHTLAPAGDDLGAHGEAVQHLQWVSQKSLHDMEG